MIIRGVKDKHWRLGPSSSERWMECPGSAAVEIDEPANEYMIRGTRLHSAAELLARDGLPFFGNERDTAQVQQCVKHAQQLPGEKHYEVVIQSDVLPEDHGGTIDVLAVTDDTIRVMDYKFGSTHVKAAKNPQVGLYLALARQEFPGRSKFVGYIDQPARYNRVRSTEFSAEELDSLEERTLAAATDTTLRAGKHCKYCPLRRLGCAVYEANR